MVINHAILPNFCDGIFHISLHVYFTMGESELSFGKTQIKLIVC